MKNSLRFLFTSILLTLFLSLFSSTIKAQNANCDDLLKNSNDSEFLVSAPSCLNNWTQAKNQSVAATKPLESQLNGIKARVAFIETDLIRKKQEIDNGYKNLTAKKIIFDKTVAKNYIESYNNNWLSYLVGTQATDIIQNLAYQKAKADQDKVIITNIALSITDLEGKKINLESEEVKLAAIKVTLDKIVTEAKAYQANLSGKIAALSARQQEILNQRLSALGIPLFASSLGRCSSDIGKDPGFSGGFGFFTYGVPNRVGLNQYGAFGRSKAGQGYEQILRAYYNFDSIEKKDATINVEGYHGYSLDDYVKRIYEVPNDWGSQGGMEALKAQAIAARSYAMAYTNNGSGSICTTEQCQVFQDNPKGGNWEQAVNDTAGLVMIQGGNPVKAWFSSTHGGYIHASSDIGWSSTSWTKNAQDTTGNVSSFSDLKNNAYDKDSPWFYCDWGSRSDYNKTAWLKPSEVADIVNVILLVQNQSDTATKEHLYQTDKSNPAGTDTWSADRVRQELSKYLTPYTSISDISVSPDFGSGKINSVNVSGDGGSRSIPGDFFKTYFNLRAPANIQIVGPLYNIERN